MKLEITGTARLAILAETDHERQWLKAFTSGFKAPVLWVEYTYPNYSPKDFNNPCVMLTMEGGTNERIQTVGEVSVDKHAKHP